MPGYQKTLRKKGSEKMENDLLEVYVTKYALTKGVQKRRVKLTSVSGMVKDSEEGHLYYHGKGKDWHYTLSAATKKAIEMKTKKVKSLKKQIHKLEALAF